jgi:hypothetical protein
MFVSELRMRAGEKPLLEWELETAN